MDMCCEAMARAIRKQRVTFLDQGLYDTASSWLTIIGTGPGWYYSQEEGSEPQQVPPFQEITHCPWCNYLLPREVGDV